MRVFAGLQQLRHYRPMPSVDGRNGAGQDVERQLTLGMVAIRAAQYKNAGPDLTGPGIFT